MSYECKTCGTEVGFTYVVNNDECPECGTEWDVTTSSDDLDEDDD